MGRRYHTTSYPKAPCGGNSNISYHACLAFCCILAGPGQQLLWEENWRKIKVNLGWWQFLFNMRKEFLMNKVRLFWCFVKSITWENGEKNSSSDVVLYRYSFKTQTIGFEIIRVSGFWGKFYPKVFKGTNRARLKNMLVYHHPGLFFRIDSAGRGFFLSFWDGKDSINPYLYLWLKKIFSGMNIKRIFWPACFW